MSLLRNSEYHGRFTGNVQRVELPALADFSAQWEMYESDVMDVTNLRCVPEMHRERARLSHAGEHISVPELSTWYLAFHSARPPFDDARVRRAFALAIDRRTVADSLLTHFVCPAEGGFVPPGMPGHSPGIGLGYDPEQARRLLAQAGYPDGRGLPTIDAQAPTRQHRRLRVLRQQWQENLAVDVTWKELEQFCLPQLQEKQLPHISLQGWAADYPDPDAFMKAWHVIQDCNRWQNDAFDELVDQARQSTDHEARMTLYGQADRILMEEATIMPLSYGRTNLLLKPWVSRFPTSPVRHWFWKDVVVDSH